MIVAVFSRAAESGLNKGCLDNCLCRGDNGHWVLAGRILFD